MNTDMRRTSGLLRSSTALGATVLVLGSLALGACSKTDASGTATSAIGAGQVQHDATNVVSDADTVDLVNAALETPAVDSATPGADARQGNRKALRAQLLRGLHGVWVTNSKSGFVTHQAIRGDVTAVSGSSITVKAKDGFSLTFTVAADTKVRARTNGKGSDSTIGAVKVGSKALVTGLGATNPKARVVVFATTTSQPGSTPSPSATS
jgi:hypothetical protein